MALGLTNLYLKRLIRKGYVKCVTVSPNRLVYSLTPKGVALLKDVVGLSRVALLVNANDPDAAARYGGWSSG